MHSVAELGETINHTRLRGVCVCVCVRVWEGVCGGEEG